MSNNDITIDTTTLPPAVTAVWSAEDQVLIVSTTATPTQAAEAWSEVTSRPFPGLPEHRRRSA